MSKVSMIQTYYDELIATGYDDYRVLGWESLDAQIKRFDVLVQNFSLEGKRILDVGCGLGSLYKYLKDKNIKVDYTGIDLQSKIIEKAKKLNPEACFICSDIFKELQLDLESYDLVFASGIFNLDLGNNRDFLKMAVRKFFMLACEGFAFNLLHPDSPSKELPYFYICPEEVLEILKCSCPEGINVEVVKGYLPNDYSVIANKQSAMEMAV